MKYEIIILCAFVTIISIQQAFAQFIIADQEGAVSVVYDAESSALDSIAAHLLARDIEMVSGWRPEIYTNLHEVNGNAIIIGEITSGVINAHVDTARLSGQWETYGRVFKNKVTPGIGQAMFIAGSDSRGMAYGVFDLSREIGVSPWYWWADVPVKKQDRLTVSRWDTFSTTPSVKYRGIFLNDEGWGLEPWASKTFEPSVGNMGPKTYAKIFELLFRLKANMLWPAMHPNTVPFFQVPGNPETAREWNIVVGSSHAEPMLRNNVGEWDHEKMGHFNYQTNAANVYKYWEERVKQSREMDAIYTVGMRGVHDSGMEGFDSMDEKVSGLEQVISDQRELLRGHIGKEVAGVPQSFTPYKEVLEIYESGMELPKDITITWPDDNHGYIRRFSDEAEQGRTGGAGVYYHLSYLGAPHPYIWLSPTTPALVWREMTRAWQQNMHQLWIANVGDIKRREWETEFFLDLAWNIDTWGPGNIKSYFETVAARDISTQHASEISGMMWEYYRLATERKPEFMGFNESQWAGWPPVKDPLYNMWTYNDEVEQRIRSYRELQSRAKKLSKAIPEKAADAYFELVYYPISAAAAMYEKWLYAYKSREYAEQGWASANAMSDSAFAAFDQLQKLSQQYSHDVAGGKWQHMVDYSPGYKKGSSVFFEPITARIKTEGVKGLGVAIEGQPLPLEPLSGRQPDINTQESNITMNASEAALSGELTTETDSSGTFLHWPEEGSGRTISGPESWDTIPYEVDHPTKAVFAFNLEEAGGVHSLYLSVEHPHQDSDSWWVTVNDRAPVLVEGGVGNIQKLKVEDVVLRKEKNILTIHPREDGAKLYGVALEQESRQISPKYTNENKLPAFNRYVQKSHFMDLFSRGKEEQKWSASTSEPWIELSKRDGTLKDGSERIWVSVNYDAIPVDSPLEGHIEISSGDFSYRVEVQVFNRELQVPSHAFVETDGVISMPASQYHEKQEGSAASWRLVTGLGRSGSAMLPEPMEGWYIEDLSEVAREAPVLEYEIVVTEGGKAEVMVEAVPAFPLKKSQSLRCAISIGDEAPQWVTFEMGKEWDQQWAKHVLESRMTGTTRVELDPGTHRLRLWGTDPSLNIDKIVIDFGGLESSYAGPPSTRKNQE